MPVPTVRVRFIPQAWIRNYAVEVDPEGAAEYDVPARDAQDTDGQWLRDHDYASDALKGHDNAPAWIWDWSGPFEVEIDRETHDQDLMVQIVRQYGAALDMSDPDHEDFADSDFAVVQTIRDVDAGAVRALRRRLRRYLGERIEPEP